MTVPVLAGEHVDRTPGDTHFEAELEGFLDAVANGEPEAVRCPYEEGLATLELTLDATEAIEEETYIRR